LFLCLHHKIFFVASFFFLSFFVFPLFSFVHLHLGASLQHLHNIPAYNRIHIFSFNYIFFYFLRF
jgi:hypothetical protein